MSLELAASLRPQSSECLINTYRLVSDTVLIELSLGPRVQELLGVWHERKSIILRLPPMP